MGERRNPLDERAHLPMTPMIDVVFLLLIFFMLTMHFREIEGVLKTQLPRDKSPAPLIHVIPIEEIRVVICAGGDTRMHLNDKGRHERETKPNEVCTLMVDRNLIGPIYLTARQADKVGSNKEMYRKAGETIRSLWETHRGPQDPTRMTPVVIDADSEAPYEHIIGIVNVLKEHRIDNLEFVGNPRWDEYYGTGKRGQMKR